jgi:FkbM family methyltransferase
MPLLRSLAKSCVVGLMGPECKPRKILRGLASGYRIWVSPAENLSYLLGTAEPHLQRAIQNYVSPGDTVYDIGAHIGYVSLSLARRVGSGGRVLAFEPVPQNFAMIHRNVEINNLKNIEVLQIAASDRRGEATIRIAGNLSTASLVWHRNDRFAEELTVKTEAIDDLVEAGSLVRPSFVKIDVEGAEGYALRGMRRTVAAANPVIFIECSEAGRETAWSLLSELGFRCQSATTLRWVETFEDYRHSDFLWLPSGR